MVPGAPGSPIVADADLPSVVDVESLPMPDTLGSATNSAGYDHVISPPLLAGVFANANHGLVQICVPSANLIAVPADVVIRVGVIGLHEVHVDVSGLQTLT